MNKLKQKVQFKNTKKNKPNCNWKKNNNKMRRKVKEYLQVFLEIDYFKLILFKK